ncbi:MAG: glycosyltransferase, partial [Gammaproteobacteria bacterium]
RESFSLVVMESWLAERPVLVHGYCDVTSNHCQQSDGGLYFVDFSEFEMCVRYLLENNYISMQMGKNGRDYVLKNYSWDKITKDYIDFLKN